MSSYKVTGPIYGMVTDNNDPEGYGRLRVKLQHNGNEIETDWILMVIPFDIEFILPDVGDMVAVVYANDNLNQASIIGRAAGYEQDEGSELNKDDNSISIIKSSNGYRIMMSGTKDNEKIQIFTPEGERYDVLTDGPDVQLTTYGEINREMQLSAKEKITLNGKDGQIEITNETPNDRVNVKIKIKSENEYAEDDEDTENEDSKINLN